MLETITVRTASSGDLSAIDALLARSYPRLLKADYPPSVMVTVVPLISRAQPRLVRSGTYYVAETTAGAIVGAGGWTPRGGDMAEVRHLVTDDRWVRQGVARSLMAQSMTAARVSGARKMTCFATRTAEPFYHAVGFQTIGAVTIQLRPGIRFPALRMERAL